ncbi:MAG: hypothetical protein JNN07_15705 [Verrucomicrobiales bacterium]|nr:hypothetical protein [Verrucomicrobiales bacterium]
MRKLARDFKDAVVRDDFDQAKSILLASLAQNETDFVNALRKEGALRYSRYGFRTKTIVPLLEEVLRSPPSPVAEETRKYFRSVLALAEVANAVCTKLAKLRKSFNAASLTRYNEMPIKSSATRKVSYRSETWLRML